MTETHRCHSAIKLMEFVVTTRRFEYIDAKSSKFWEIKTSGKRLTIRYGKIGTDGQTTLKELASPAEAKAQAGKLILEKTKKGYVTRDDVKNLNHVIDDFDAIFSESSVIGEKGKSLKKYVKPKQSCTFKCYKSFQENKIFSLKTEIVTYSVLYRFASINFGKGEAPSCSKDGHFFDIDIGTNFLYEDPWVDGFEVKILDKKLQTNVNKLITTKDWAKKLHKLGFQEEVTYDILVNELAGSTFEINN